MSQGINHYDVLSLPSSVRQRGTNDQTKIKRAYHEALLKHHPDKISTVTANQPSVDMIKQAFDILSDPVERARYDKQLSVRQKSTEDQGFSFNTGEELIDLDDLVYDDHQEVWYRSCRCGEDRGFILKEQQMEKAVLDDDREVLIGCIGCSLWLRVAFDISSTAHEEEHGNG